MTTSVTVKEWNRLSPAEKEAKKQAYADKWAGGKKATDAAADAAMKQAKNVSGLDFLPGF